MRGNTGDEMQGVEEGGNAMTNIIKVRFARNGHAYGHEYTYYTPESVGIGDMVDIETRRGIAHGIVTQVDVPEAEIEPFKDKAKSILGKMKAESEEATKTGGETDADKNPNPGELPGPEERII